VIFDSHEILSPFYSTQFSTNFFRLRDLLFEKVSKYLIHLYIGDNIYKSIKRLTTTVAPSTVGNV